MYRNTMYISTITSWLHSHWHRHIATKIALITNSTQHQWHCEFDSHKTLQFSCRTLNKNNTEYRTSVQKITLLHQTKKTLKRNKTQKQFFTVTVANTHDTYWDQNSDTIDFEHYWCYQNCNIALQRYSDFQQSQ